MKDFLKYMLATIVGIILSGVIFAIVGIVLISGMVAVMASANAGATDVKDNSVLQLDLTGVLIERNDNSLYSELFSEEKTCNLEDMLNAIKKAKNNDNIKGIYIKADVFAASPASLEEIRAALSDFKKKGKFIMAYGDSYTQGSYYLSSIADHLMLNPQGNITWMGLAAQPIFYKDLLSKIGVEMQVFRVGTYKSAVEPFMATEMSDANREQVSSFLHSIWNQMLADISASRKVSVETLNICADSMIMLKPATDYIKYKMADELAYADGAKSYLKKKLGMKDDEKLNILTVEDMKGVSSNVPKDKSGNVIAVYYAYGEISDSDEGNSYTSGSEGIYADKMMIDLRRLRNDDDVKAVVLRVNSPGGSAYASEQIWHEVAALKEKKPVIVSMGDYAASGGYYISCAASRIVAQPTTLTGSIGIFGLFPNAKGLLTDKLGLHFDVVKTNKYGDFGSINRPMSAEESALLQAYINRGYDTFMTRCADGRKLSKDSINAIGQGRVWTGEQAQKIGLVDELGGLDKAITIAADKAKVKTYTLSYYPAQQNFFESLMNTAKSDYMNTQLKSNFGEYYEYLRDINFMKNIDKADRIQARVPFNLNLNINR